MLLHSGNGVMITANMAATLCLLVGLAMFIAGAFVASLAIYQNPNQVFDSVCEVAPNVRASFGIEADC